MTGNRHKVDILQRIVHALMALGFLGAGVAIAGFLIATRPQPAKVEREDLGELVRVEEIQSQHQEITITANGTVVPAQQIMLAAEVGGRVTWISPELIPGGRVSQNQQLMRIDARDYKLALEQQFAQVDRARTELEVERGRK